MTFESEWAQIKRDTSVHMSLASADGEPGDPFSSQSGQGELHASREAWEKASEAVGSVQANLKTALGELEKKQDGLVGQGGLESTGAHAAVHRSWRRKLDLVGRECGELKDKLAKSGDAYYKSEDAIKAAFQAQQTKPTEDPPSGPLSKGRE